MAAAHEKLPHIQFENFMVSNTDSPGEGWPLVDELDDSCLPPEDGIYYPGKPLPNVVHYCQNFRAANIGFAKRSANKQMFSCDAPLFVEPPSDLAFSDFRIHKRKVCLLQVFVLAICSLVSPNFVLILHILFDVPMTLLLSY